MGRTSNSVSPKAVSGQLKYSVRTGAGRFPLLLPPACPSSRARRCVYSPNYRGGAGWQASHHRFPAGLGLGTLQTPAAVSQMWRRCPTVKGEPFTGKTQGPKREILRMWEELAELALTWGGGGGVLKCWSRELGASAKCHSKQSGV